MTDSNKSTSKTSKNQWQYTIGTEALDSGNDLDRSGLCFCYCPTAVYSKSGCLLLEAYKKTVLS